MKRDISVFANLIADGCDKYGDKTILTFVDEAAGITETRSYNELYRNGNALAAFPAGAGHGKRRAVLRCCCATTLRLLRH